MKQSLEVKKKGLPLSHQNKGTLFEILVRKKWKGKPSRSTGRGLENRWW